MSIPTSKKTDKAFKEGNDYPDVVGADSSSEAKKKPKLKLSDFYFKDKHTDGTHMPILLPNGEDSGEWLVVVGPESDIGIKNARAFTAALRVMTAEHKALHDKATEEKDFTEYNLATADQLLDLQMQFAANVVTGWSLEEEFTPEALDTLLHQYKALTGMIAAHHQKTNDILTAK